MAPETKVIQCLAHAEEHLRSGSRELGVALVLEAQKEVESVADPITFLGLWVRIDHIYLKHRIGFGEPS